LPPRQKVINKFGGFFYVQKIDFIINFGSRRTQQGRLPVRILPPRQKVIIKIGDFFLCAKKWFQYKLWQQKAATGTPAGSNLATPTESHQ
jgi:hypothetical protein